ncbi:MAG: SH3 domain-containing protein [Anaerolineae bacterium]|nr:SH3 domain-containing protein [Anaerolineae bacterium]
MPGGIGDPSLIDAGVLDAIDIWGRASDVQFCFLKRGRLVFVDTATLPRVTSNLAAETINGMTCGSVDRIGMVVLLRADETASDASDAPAAAAETGPSSPTICQLQTTGYLSLRAGPSVYFARLDVMPLGARALGMARSGDWFLVNYQGQRGWASGAYLAASPACDDLCGSSRLFFPLETEPAPVEGEAQEEMPEPAETEEPAPDELVDCRLTAGDIINLRTKPGTEQYIEAEIPFRTQLIAIERSGDWFKVEYEGIIGWVNIAYVFRRGVCG